jgi:hypothetical protein
VTPVWEALARRAAQEASRPPDGSNGHRPANDFSAPEIPLLSTGASTHVPEKHTATA